MLWYNKRIVIVGFCLALQACTQIDNYMLGKDNTPKPAPLSDLKPSLTLVENWSVSMGKPGKTSANLKLKPVIHDHIIYAASANGMVQAMETKTGHVLWSKQLTHNLISGPTVANGYIALGTNRSRVVLLNQRDGSELRVFKVSGDALSKPAIVGNKLIIKTIDGFLYAFDLKTGNKLWASEHGSPSLILKASSSPIIMGNLVLVGFSDGKLDAIDADPIVRDGNVYLASYQGYVGALSIANGEFIWQKPASVYKNMALDSSTLYMTDSDDVLWALNRSNGQVKWKQLAFKARGLTDPMLLGNRLIVGDRTGYVHVLSSSSGELLSRTQSSGSIDIAPAVAGHSIYVMTANGKLSRFSVS